MRERAGTLLITLLLMVGIALIATWEYYTAPARSGRERQPRAVLFPPPYGGFTGMAGRYLAGSPSFMVMPEIRLFATHAVQAGPYTVSLRQLRGQDRSSNLLATFTGNAPPEGPSIVVLQVYCPDTEALAGCEMNASSLVARDARGQVIPHFRLNERMLGPRDIPHGRVYFVGLTVKATDRFIASLEGTLSQSGPYGPDRRFPFRLTEIPLPGAPRLFGNAYARRLSTGAARRLPAGMQCVTGPEAEALARESQSDTPAPGYPLLQLLLPEQRAVPLRIPAPFSPRLLTLSAASQPVGAITLTVRHQDRQRVVNTWDREAVLIALPQEGKQPRRAVLLRMSREYAASWRMPVPPPPFPTPPGRAGGAIQMSVQVGSRPFGRGYLSIRLWQRRPQGWSDPARLALPLSDAGRMLLPNLAAGEYRMERLVSSLAPMAPIGMAPAPLAPYMKARFRAEGGQWVGVSVERIAVRDGQTTDVPPLQWRPAPDSPASAVRLAGLKARE